MQKDDIHQFFINSMFSLFRIQFLFIAITLILFCCKSSKPINQGISGRILWFEGDLMPGIDKEPVPGKPIVRKIYFYAPTHISQATETEHIFYSEVQTRLIDTVESDEEGDFSIWLEPGTYSVFVEESKGLYANRYNEYGLINPVKVFPNQVTEVELRVDYEAAY